MLKNFKRKQKNIILTYIDQLGSKCLDIELHFYGNNLFENIMNFILDLIIFYLSFLSKKDSVYLNHTYEILK